MTPHNRKYGEKQSCPFPVWNGRLDGKHRSRIGAALWEYDWCIDRTTRELDGVGFVLDGRPVTAQYIADTFNTDGFSVSEKTVRCHLKQLARHGYLRLKLAPYGFIIHVVNSAKFGIWKSHKRSERNVRPIPQEVGSFLPGRSEDFVQPGRKEPSDVKETQQYAAKDAAEELPVRSALWGLIEVNPQTLPPGLVELCDRLYSTNGDQTLFELLGVCMDAWQAQGNKIPAAFAKAKARLKDSETLARVAFPAPETEEWGLSANYQAGVR